ncbi:MAG: hypothetical protein AB2A00_39950 [Myxococcota bacterium]
MKKSACLLLCLFLLDGCARSLPMGRNKDLPSLTPAGNTPMDITLGPKGREALIGEFVMAPEGMGVDLSSVIPDAAGLASGAVWCAEPVAWVDGGLIVNVGMTWWPPGAEPNAPSRSITEGLMRCLGYLDVKPWARAVVTLRPASLPRVEYGGALPLMQAGTDTLAAAIEQAFLFGISAPLQARGLALGAGTQDGVQDVAERGLKKRVEAHIKHEGTGWMVSNRITYSPAQDADVLQVLASRTQSTTVEGISYLMATGNVTSLLPTTLPRGALRIRTGFGTTTVTLTAKVRAEKSEGLSCVLRTLSPPIVAPGQEAPKYPGVDLEAAQKCPLSEEDQAGPNRKLK